MIFPKDTLLHWELYSTISIYAKLNDLGLPLVDSFHLPRSRGGGPLIPREFGKENALARMSNGMQWHYKIFLSLNLRLCLVDLRLPPPDFVSPREREGGVPL